MAALAISAAAMISLAVGRVSIALGPRVGLVDTPDDHLKPHVGTPVPLGGLGVLLGLQAGLLIAGAFDWGFLVGTLLVWSVGIVDDRVGVPPVWRLAVTALAGVAIGVSQNALPGVWGVLASAGLVVVVVNAINLFDGMDGLAGSVGVVAALGLAALAALRGAGPVLPSILAATLVGFLVWNLPPARLFLGDNGAYVLGASLVWVALGVSSGLASSAVAVALIGVPLLDLVVTVVRRARRGAALFEGDRSHSYDSLRRGGLSDTRVVLALAAAQTIWAGLIVSASAILGDVAAVVFAMTVGAAAVVWWLWGRLQSGDQMSTTPE